MKIAKIAVSGVQAKPEIFGALTSGMVGATVAFEFTDPMWEGLSKTVVYKTRHGVRDDLNMGGDGVSKIPPELLQCYGLELRVGVYGVNDAGDLVIPTVWASLGYIKAGADPSGDPGADPSLPPWYQLRQDVGNLEELDTKTKENLVKAINEVLASGGTANWNAAEGEPGHILNRTHWVEVGKGEILPECQPVYNADENVFQLPGALALEVGKECTVNWNGVAYTCIVQEYTEDGLTVPVLGDLSLMFGGTSTGEPFLIMSLPPEVFEGGATMILALDGSASLTLSIYQSGETVHKLDEKFIPDTVARKADLEPLQEAVEVGQAAAEAASAAQTAATNAQTTATNAQTAAENARSAAKTAQASADSKLNKKDPTGTGSFSMNRKADTEIGLNSHAEGLNCTASGNNSHAEGANTVASGHFSHAEGGSTVAEGMNSHAEGDRTIAAGYCQHVQGKYNAEDTENKYAHIVGNGANDEARKNIHTVDWAGVGWFLKSLKVGGTSQDDAKNVLLEGEAATDNYINSLIDAKLGVIENGTY